MGRVKYPYINILLRLNNGIFYYVNYADLFSNKEKGVGINFENKWIYELLFLYLILHNSSCLVLCIVDLKIHYVHKCNSSQSSLYG